MASSNSVLNCGKPIGCIGLVTLLLCITGSMAISSSFLSAEPYKYDIHLPPRDNYVVRLRRRSEPETTVPPSTEPPQMSTTGVGGPSGNPANSNSSTASTPLPSTNSSRSPTNTSRPVRQTTVAVTTRASTTKSIATSTTPPLASSTLPSNTSIRPVDDRKYYTVQYYSPSNGGAKYWREIDDDKAFTHYALEGRARALQIPISWNFTFYGHDVDKITIAIGGFLYMSPFLHRYLAATQYVAPLMADFDSSIADGAVVAEQKDDALIVEWRKIKLTNNTDVGPFTFQVQLYKADGKIVFAYKNIPIQIGNIQKKTVHPIKVGLADAYYYDIGRFRYIYEYHNLTVDFTQVVSNSAVIFTHKRTCNMIKDCYTCHNANIPQFDCYWCERLGGCSDARDRTRQRWLQNRCPYTGSDKRGITPSSCGDPSTTGGAGAEGANQQQKGGSSHSGVVAGVVIGVILLTLISAVAAFIVYGYWNPTSSAGQFVIKYRPSELSRRWKSRGSTAERYRVGTQTLTNEAYEGAI